MAQKITIWANKRQKTANQKSERRKNEEQKIEKSKRVVVSVKGRDFLVPTTGFFQANIYLTPTLVDTVLEMCGDINGATVVDAYCGSGLFSGFLSDAEQIIAVEQDQRALACAEANIASFGYQKACFYAGDCGAVFHKQVLRRGINPAVVVIDPPRAGCSGAFVAYLCLLKNARLVYVSCNPITMARDLRKFINGGFRLKELRMLDMFPQCAHIEAIALLEKR